MPNQPLTDPLPTAATDPTDATAEIEDHDRGLGHDLHRLLGRRRALAFLGGAGLVAVATACGAGGGSDDAASSSTSNGDTSRTNQSTGQAGESTTSSSSSDSSGGSCSTEIPEETAGPFPGDGSNGPNVLTESGVVRSDITSSFGDANGVAEGVALTVEMTVVDTGNGCQPLEGAAVYAWHCDREGRYSMYTEGAEDENYLRGVQEAGTDGVVRFTTIFPAAYMGRWPHIHFEVYPTLDDATSASNRLRTSQLAFPEDVCNQVYETEGYEQSVSNMQRTPIDSDMVFADGYSLQMAKTSGSVDEGYTATLTVPV